MVSQSGLSGDILEFRIKFKGTNTSSSRHMIDNILVAGQQVEYLELLLQILAIIIMVLEIVSMKIQ